MEQRFAYHRSLTPNLAVLLGLAICETLVVHVVAMAVWGRTVAIVLGVFDLSLVLWIVRIIRDLKTHPVTISDGVLTMRFGRLKSLAVPIDRIAGLREQWDAAALKQPGVVNLALATWPNVVIDLSDPVLRRGRPVFAVAHKIDDPAAFALALNLCMGRA